MARIGIDLDGCGFPFVDEFIKYVARRLYIKTYALPYPRVWDFHTEQWGLTNDQLLELMRDAVRDGELWRHGKPELDFVSALWQLSELGHTVIICTDKTLGDPVLERQAQKFVRAWLQSVRAYYDELLFTADKSLAQADIFIDDKPSTVPTLRLEGVDAVYYSRPWNQSFPCPRVRSWAEFVRYVEEATSVQAG